MLVTEIKEGSRGRNSEKQYVAASLKNSIAQFLRPRSSFCIYKASFDSRLIDMTWKLDHSPRSGVKEAALINEDPNLTLPLVDSDASLAHDSPPPPAALTAWVRIPWASS
jgi:hypothetical protein